MPLSNYPGGFAAGVSIRGVPVLQTHPGKVFWVYNGTVLDQGHKNGSDGNKGTFDAPFATLDYAIGMCRANKGDIIFIKPGHAENISAAGTVTADVAGIAIIGLGVGTDRPTFTWTATAGTFVVSANNVLMSNLRFVGGIDAVVSAVPVSGTDFKAYDISWFDSTGQVLEVFTVSGARATFDGYRHHGTTTIGSGANDSNAAISLNAAHDSIITNCWVYGRFDISIVQFITTASLNVQIYDCRFANLDNRAAGTAGTAIEDVITGSSGRMGPDLYITLGANAANITEAITGATFHVHDNVYVVNAVHEKAMLINWTASTDA